LRQAIRQALRGEDPVSRPTRVERYYGAGREIVQDKRVYRASLETFLAGDHTRGIIIVNAQDVQKAGLPGD
jgi:hypothetical protein